MNKSTSNNDMSKIIEAINFAIISRKNITKDSYINHSIEVASLLADAGVTDVDILRSAVLHDVINSCGIKLHVIKEQFGENVSKLVLECTNDKSIDKITRKRNEVINAKTSSLGAKLIKLADKISKLKILEKELPDSWTEEMFRGYLVWTRAIYETIRGQNQYLDNLIEEIFTKHGVTCLNKNELEEYYQVLEVSQLI